MINEVERALTPTAQSLLLLMPRGFRSGGARSFEHPRIPGSNTLAPAPRAETLMGHNF